MDRRVLISGAGIAGLTLANLLKKQGFAPTVVERSPVLRTGGYKIDIRGSAIEVIKRMGLYEQVAERRTDVADVAVYDYAGNRIASIDSDVSGTRVEADVELMRGDLCHVLMDSIPDVECVFSESVTEIREREHDLQVYFENMPPRSFDLIIGADGLHSNIRRLAFGDESQFLKPLGLCVVVFSIPCHVDTQEKEFFEAGKYVNIYNSPDGASTIASFGFIPKTEPQSLFSREEQQALLISSFEGAPEDIQKLFSQLSSATDFYFDSVAQVHMPSWSKGRVALVGDAGYAPTPLSGQGTSMALIGAYALADELAKNEYRRAFENYESRLRSFVAKNQELVGFSLAYMGIDPDAWTAKFLKYLIEKNPGEIVPLLKEFGVMQVRDAANAFSLCIS